MRLLVSLAAVIAITSCGTSKQAQTPNKPVVSEESAKEKGATLPAVTIVRVPVGADGKEVNDQAELRTTNEQTLSNENVASTFAAAKAPVQILDELDTTSSTQSFCGWRYWRRCARCGYWDSYAPAYYNYGYYYNYSYTRTYTYSGYNYYHYNSSFGRGYTGYAY
ncbi:MAG: hypothetical protein WCO71_04645 [Pseudomonadota bacterium]